MNCPCTNINKLHNFCFRFMKVIPVSIERKQKIRQNNFVTKNDEKNSREEIDDEQ